MPPHIIYGPLILISTILNTNNPTHISIRHRTRLILTNPQLNRPLQHLSSHLLLQHTLILVRRCLLIRRLPLRNLHAMHQHSLQIGPHNARIVRRTLRVKVSTQVRTLTITRPNRFQYQVIIKGPIPPISSGRAPTQQEMFHLYNTKHGQSPTHRAPRTRRRHRCNNRRSTRRS